MTYGAYTPRHAASFERNRRSKASVPHAVLCAIALILGASMGLAVLYGGRTPPAPSHIAALAPVAMPAPVVAAVAPAKPTPPPLPTRRDAGFLDPTFTGGYAARSFAESGPRKAGFEPPQPVRVAVNLAAPPVLQLQTMEPDPDETTASIPVPPVASLSRDIPLPAPRPAILRMPDDATTHHHRLAELPMPAAPGLPPPRPNFFDKMFGRQPMPGTALAYATPDDGDLGLGAAARLAGPDRWTAVYNIAAHTVTLPDGTRLEAHSGLGSRLDDPHSVAEHMRGATPPNVYELQPREALFHGVAALRLNPIGPGTTYGRAGLLAHTYMLGPRGDSNGCVVFKNYRAFRAAYDNGTVRRLVVVAGRD